MCAMTPRPYGWYLGNIAKIDQEPANGELFQFVPKTVVTIRPKLSTTILHYMCKDIKTVWLGFEKHSQN